MSATTQKKTIVAIVPAAGSGTRLGLGPKAFLQLAGRSLLRRTVECLYDRVDRVIVAAPADLLSEAEQDVGTLAKVIVGGATRHQSVGLLLAECTEDIVVLHEIARPLASAELVRQVILAADDADAVIAAIPAVAPILLQEHDRIVKTLPREQVLHTQTPHAYKRSVLAAAYDYAAAHTVETQSTAQLVENAGFALSHVAGEATNVKITTELDWQIVQRVFETMQAREEGR